LQKTVRKHLKQYLFGVERHRTSKEIFDIPKASPKCIILHKISLYHSPLPDLTQTGEWDTPSAPWLQHLQCLGLIPLLLFSQFIHWQSSLTMNTSTPVQHVYCLPQTPSPRFSAVGQPHLLLHLAHCYCIQQC